MADLKTKPTKASVQKFITSTSGEQKQRDCHVLLQVMEEVTGENATLWGPSMIGFGKYHYQYASGHEGDSFLTGFSPRKQNLTIYLMPGFDAHEDLLKKLGKFKTAKACLYIKKLEDVDLAVLKSLIKRSVETTRKQNHL